MGGPEGDILKGATIQSALFSPDDQAFCRTAENHEEMLKYLTNKYQTPDLIPNMVSDLLKMRPPTNYSQSYKNLSQFEILIQHLKNTKSEARLDKSTRNQILPVCLQEADRRLYCQEELTYDQSLVSELQESGLVDGDDNLSVIVESNEHLLEDKRRDFFINKLLEYLKVSKYMMNSSGTIFNNNTSSSQYGSSGHKQKQRRNQISPGFSQTVHQQNSPGHFQSPQPSKCPLCRVVHKDQQNRPLHSLGRCLKFQQLAVSERQSTIKRLNYCSRCLRDKNHFPHNNNTCQLSDEKGLACKNHLIPSTSHHPLLCNSKEANNKPKPNPKQTQGNKPKQKIKNKTKANVTLPSEPQNQGSTSAFCNDLWDFKPQYLPRVTMLNQSLNFKTTVGSHDMLSLKDRNLFTSSSVCTMVSPLGHLFTSLSILDNGSGLGFVSQKLVDQHSLKHVGYWHGRVVTLNGEQQNKYPVYEVVILDYLNKKHHVKLLLMNDLGFKRLVPRALFNKVCSSLGISNSAVMNLEGEYGCLLGIDSVHLLGSRVTHFSSSQYQNVALFQSPLSRLYYILGTVGPALDCRTFNTTQVYHTKPENSRGSTTTGCSVEENVVVSKMNMSTFQDNVKKL